MAENPLHDVLLTALDEAEDLHQEVQGSEDLEVAARAAAEVGTGRAGEAAAMVLLGTIDGLPGREQQAGSRLRQGD